MTTTIKTLDPVQGLIDYVNDIKPYHSKVIEALIEYVGTDKINVTVLEDFDFTIGILYEFDGEYVCAVGGYGTPSFGDPSAIFVLSPDVSKTILEYPSIGDGYFIVLGDRTRLFDPDVDVDLSMISYIEDKLIDVTSSAGSPTANEFFVTGDKTSMYTTGRTISIVGSAYNDGDYTVATSLFMLSPERTRITVNEPVPANNVEGFVRTTDPNSGSFTVINSEYIPGHLIPHTKVFQTGVTYVAPTLIDDNQRFISSVGTQPLEYSAVLGYSTALRGSPADPYLADEGTLTTNIVNLTPTSFSILGNFESSNLFIGDEIIVNNSSGNDGTYNITSLVYEYDATVTDFVTRIGVSAVPDTNIDGTLQLYIPSNVFVIEGGNYSAFFVQGSRVNNTSGTYTGIYTTLNSKFINDKTYVRVKETIIDENHGGLKILTTGIDQIGVDGDVTSTYTNGQQFNILGSAKNNGSYTAAGSPASVYNALTNITTIYLAPSVFDPTDMTGDIYEFTKGDITYVPEGFGGSINLCELIPDSVSATTFSEHFDVFLAHRFNIESTEAVFNRITIDDDDDQTIYNIINNGFTGSPPDARIEVISSGVNNGVYNIGSVLSAGGKVVITLAASPAASLENTGTLSGSPMINAGILLYKKWYQYYVTNIVGSPADTFVVAGDATADIMGSPPSTIQHVFTGTEYTVSSVSYDGTNTNVTVVGPIQTSKVVPNKSVPNLIPNIGGSPPAEIYGSPPYVIGSPPTITIDLADGVGSPPEPYDDWIISV